MTDLEALEKAAKAAQKSEGWVTTDWFSVKALEDSICFEPADARFTALASPAAVLSLLSAHRAALEKCERLERIVDSQYHAGAKAGWNAAQSDDPKKAWASLEARAVGGTDG